MLRLYNVKMLQHEYIKSTVTKIDDCVILFTSWESIELLILQQMCFD